MWKDSREPFCKNLNFSSCKQCNTCLIQPSCDGGEVSFHFNRMAHLANKVVKAMTRHAVVGRILVGEKQKIAVRGSGSNFKLRAHPSVSNVLDQNSVSLGHVQNMCMWSVGACLQRLQALLLIWKYFSQSGFSEMHFMNRFAL